MSIEDGKKKGHDDPQTDHGKDNKGHNPEGNQGKRQSYTGGTSHSRNLCARKLFRL
jgi:hypothetical protein